MSRRDMSACPKVAVVELKTREENERHLGDENQENFVFWKFWRVQQGRTDIKDILCYGKNTISRDFRLYT